jgi:hypothetical protein
MNYSFKTYKDGTVAVYIDGTFQCEMPDMVTAKRIFHNNTTN